MFQTWKPVYFYHKNYSELYDYTDKYEVSDTGNIRNIKTNKILRQFISYSGYKTVVLSKNNTSKIFTAHRIVASAFLPNPDKKEFVNHKNLDKGNNCVNNLEWCTRQENVNRSNDPL